ncbi:Adenine-specific DNA methylase, contains a Zn-ribbon domain [Desulfocicer vacuolatum DSM 3385]|uniref:Adenine-specific DNA methylase, contains a Zn-ribbon domain n=1 Tax=Desulfocicer vacuolatum DSM 3385 TaxID=1121400 RepID=A0A1W2DXJ8_9BACT|nr:DNA adenine methylase [Desulfocicer vacuolatum]SMD01786.1 Adenine-specific DNA methylase, contains a Zn-ribbon domain [Desulfocicer vacuolatum DSM 3385]
MIEKNFDIPFIADLARREKQIQQNYRPIIAVHKWFARRPGTLFRGLILSEFSENPLQKIYYNSNNFSGFHIADPFMGGGIPLLEANRLGCDVTGFDINPMSYWIVKQEIEHLNLDDYAKAAAQLCVNLENEIGHLHKTQCTLCGSGNAHVKYFLWVKTIPCKKCGKEMDLFPGYMLSSGSRHPKNVFVCPDCGKLTEVKDKKNPGKCCHCSFPLKQNGPAKRGLCKCPDCRTENRFPDPDLGAPRHRMYAMEYHCPVCKPSHKGRFFKTPDDKDLAKIKEASKRLSQINPKYIPESKIPSGDETNRLHRWGYNYYKEMFNHRQLLGLELSARLIAHEPDKRVRNALATNLSDLLRYQNMLCRYDSRALKSLDIFSIHGFPVGQIQCESNFLGIMPPGQNICIGSGGWANIIKKFKKAKSYCDHPFEVKFQGKTKKVIPTRDEWIGDHLDKNAATPQRKIHISCKDAGVSDIPQDSLDAVFTDPPYFGNIQYAELMDFCYVWLKKIVGKTTPAFKKASTRSPDELTGNLDMGRDLDHFTQGISRVFQKMSTALKPGSPLAFTYHHNKIDAYYPLAVAILDSGQTCSASLPCPAEMGSSIHINATGSSIIDTIFVCRTTGIMQGKWLAKSPEELAKIVEQDLIFLKAGNVNPTHGDIRCIAYGHLIRHAIWNLRHDWDKTKATAIRIEKVMDWIRFFGSWSEVEKFINMPDKNKSKENNLFSVQETCSNYGDENIDVPF